MRRTGKPPTGARLQAFLCNQLSVSISEKSGELIYPEVAVTGLCPQGGKSPGFFGSVIYKTVIQNSPTSWQGDARSTVIIIPAKICIVVSMGLALNCPRM